MLFPSDTKVRRLRAVSEPLGTLTSLNLANAPFHKILPNSWKYDLRELRFFWGSEKDSSAMLEVELSSHEQYIALRFSGVADLCIPSGNVITAVSIVILDVTEYLPAMPAPIRVQYRGGGGLCFWANDVAIISAA